MTWKNIIENSIQLILVFLGLSLYTSKVLQPIILESIRMETTKIENNIKTEIDNKFKKVDKVVSNMPLNVEPSSVQDISPKQTASNLENNDCAISETQYNTFSESLKRKIKRQLE